MYKLLSSTVIYKNKNNWKILSDYNEIDEWLAILQLKMAPMKNIKNVYGITAKWKNRL